MKSFVWFVLGLAGGFVVAHFVDKDPRSHELLAQVDARIGEFTDRMSDAYREQEARFTDLVDDAKGAASAAASAVAGAAADTVSAVKDTAAAAADAATDAVSDAAKTTD